MVTVKVSCILAPIRPVGIKLKKSVLEKAEMIEAIRFIENGIKIKILEVFNEYISIDTIEDLKRAKKILND